MGKNKLVAISKEETKVFIVKNVDEQEYNRLLNKEHENDSKIEQEKNNLSIALCNMSKDVSHCLKHDLILAKSVYDNFVDRGLIENDENFQQLWYDFYFNGGELNLSQAPQEYKTILEKVGNF